LHPQFHLALTALLLLGLAANAQVNSPTAEERQQKDTSSFMSRTSLGGYGNAFYQRDFNLDYSTVNLERFVLFAGHKFNKSISFFSELEVEDAKIEGGEPGGEVALEQCYLKFNFDPAHYLVAGLFLPRIGILNENHLPNTFNGNERSQVETLVIPSTWRELGVAYYGSFASLPIEYSLAVINGLNSAGFEHGSGIRSGRYSGQNASANSLAVSGALKYYRSNLRLQISGYYGGSAGLTPVKADSLQLTSGLFGTPVILGEASAQYESNGFSARLLGTVVSIPDAEEINRAYASNTPSLEYGAYAEVGYNLFNSLNRMGEQELILFTRFEILDLNASIPSNGITDQTLRQQHLIAGINYLPIRNVAVKFDVRFMHTGEENPELVINPSPTAPPYEQTNIFLNFGIGFSF
jgi:hypothetical protein